MHAHSHRRKKATKKNRSQFVQLEQNCNFVKERRRNYHYLYFKNVEKIGQVV